MASTRPAVRTSCPHFGVPRARRGGRMEFNRYWGEGAPRPISSALIPLELRPGLRRLGGWICTSRCRRSCGLIAAEAAPTSCDGLPTPLTNTGSGPKLDAVMAPGQSGEVLGYKFAAHLRPPSLARLGASEAWPWMAKRPGVCWPWMAACTRPGEVPRPSRRGRLRMFRALPARESTLTGPRIKYGGGSPGTPPAMRARDERKCALHRGTDRSPRPPGGLSYPSALPGPSPWTPTSSSASRP
jgi:hypothetical protein